MQLKLPGTARNRGTNLRHGRGSRDASGKAVMKTTKQMNRKEVKMKGETWFGEKVALFKAASQLHLRRQLSPAPTCEIVNCQAAIKSPEEPQRDSLESTGFDAQNFCGLKEVR
jgi:hypothetical protein